MYRLCKESLWIRSELSENCFHSVVKIILINYVKKTKLIHAWAGGKAQNGFAQTGREKVCDKVKINKLQ